MTRQQLEDEYARLLHLLAEPQPDRQAIEDAFRRLHLTILRWQDYAGAMTRMADSYRRRCDELVRHLEQAREGNRILLRAMTHAGGEAATGEWPSAEWCKRRCLEEG